MVSKASRVRARLTSNLKHQVPSLNLLSLSRSVVCPHCTESLQKSWDVSGVQARPQRPGSPCRSCFSRQHLTQCLGLDRRLLNVGRNLKSGGIWIQTSDLPRGAHPLVFVSSLPPSRTDGLGRRTGRTTSQPPTVSTLSCPICK